MAFAGVSFIGEGRSSTATRPASATTTVTDSGYHLIVVDGYSRTKQDYPNGERIESCPFRVAGYRWHIWYYPNGRINYADYISLCLAMDDDCGTETVKVQFRFSLVDKVQKQVPSNIHACEVSNFSKQRYSWGYGRFMGREDLESTHLEDDSLTIRGGHFFIEYRTEPNRSVGFFDFSVRIRFSIL
jgi:speckle-type POZ protein